MYRFRMGKYQELKPSLVILGDENALKFLGTKFAETNIQLYT
jgi:hypothetical protein